MPSILILNPASLSGGFPLRNPGDTKPIKRDGKVHSLLGIVSGLGSNLLWLIRNELEIQGESPLASDIRQLTGVAAKMETAGFVPITISDLTAPTGRHVMQFCNLVDAVMSELIREPFASKKGAAGAAAGSGWYGHYFSLHGLLCLLSFNAWAWAENGRSPIWLHVKMPKTRSEYNNRAFIKILEDNTDDDMRVHIWGMWKGIPLYIPEGRELDDVMIYIQGKLLKIAEGLAAVTISDASSEFPPENEVD